MIELPKILKKRETYIERIKPFIGKDIIKVLTGQRRVGKSFILFLLIDYIVRNYETSNIIYINKESFDFDFIKSAKELNDYINSKVDSRKKNYIFIDEIQDIEGFERVLRSLALNDNVDIYITGSNANMLSGELATYLSGRYVEFQINSLSYSEFLYFHNIKDSAENLNKYLKYGGLPYLINLELNDLVVFEYLKNIYNTILYRDIISRYNLRSTHLLEKLVQFIADNIGSIFSAKRISDYLKSQQINLSPTQILNYIQYLNNSFFIKKVERYDIIGKKIFESSEKYYFENLGIRNALVGFKINDLAKVIENGVYNHLIYKGYKVNVGKFNGFEIDFIAQKNNEIEYYQVAMNLIEDSTIKREFGNLLSIKDNYPKTVISLDKFDGNTYQGIKHQGLREFLLS